MKTKIISTMIIAILFIANIKAQSSYQSFPNAGFKVKLACDLEVNSTFIQTAKEQGMDNVIASYLCGENSENPDLGVINNINIYDESENYKNQQASDYETFEKRYLKQYATNLENAGISYNNTTYQGVDAIEYSFSQQGLPTKAIVFLKDKRSYLLQVGTRNNLNAKYDSLKSGFIIL